MSKEAIISLALLKVNWDKYQKSYTDNFAPLVAECIRKSSLPVISLVELQDRMLNEFGLRIPTSSLKVVLERLKKKGMVKQDHNVYIPIAKELEKPSIEQNRQKVLDEHQATVANLIEFCQRKYTVTWTEEEAEDALISYLKEYDLDILLAATQGTPLPEVARPVPNAKFLVNAFVREISEGDHVAFRYFETIVKGHLLVNALVFPDVAEIARRFERTSVFFDTRPILNSLGYQGKPYRQTSRDLLELLYETGANLRCFSHTYDEVHGILTACANTLRGGQGRPIGITSIFQGGSESDVLLAMATLERDIKRLGMKIEEKPPYVPEHQISESDLESRLQKDIGYQNDRARVRDVDSLSAIYRLRKGREYHCIEECRAIFVTTNTKLVRAAAGFFETYKNFASPPICISEHHLTNILWLKKPLLLPDLPKKRMMAAAYAAMEPSPELWRSFSAEVERLKDRGGVTADEYLLLRNSLEVRSYLMDVTLGNDEAVAEGTVSEVLEAYNAHLRAEAEQGRRAAESRERELETRLQSVRERIDRIADIAGTVVRWIAFTILVALLLLGGCSSYFSNLQPGWLRLSFTTAAFVFLVASVFSLIRGGTVKSFTRVVERKARRSVTNLLERLILGNRVPEPSIGPEKT